MDRRKFLIATAAVATIPAIGCSGSGSASAAVATPNPYLSAPLYGIVHFDSGQSDTVPIEVKRGTFNVDPNSFPRVVGGPVNIMTLASTDPDYMWAVGTDRVAYVSIVNGAFKSVAEIALPGVKRLSGSQMDALIAAPLGGIKDLDSRVRRIFGSNPGAVTLANGLYSLADNENTVYANVGAVLHAIGLIDAKDPAKGLEVKRSLDMATVFKPFSLMGSPASVRLVGMGMTFDGHIVAGSLNGIAVLERSFSKPAVVHTIEPGQFVSNSFAIDEKNAIYLASGNVVPKGDGMLHKLVWTGSAISVTEADGGWIAPYTGGDWPPAIKAGTGTGATPSLMGFGDDENRFVVLTDGANRMNIVAFWRDAIPADFKQKAGTRSRRIADQRAVTAGQSETTAWVQSEQSVVVNGFGAFVVNNIGTGGHPDKLIEVLALGPLIDPPSGMERFEWDVPSRSWKTVWTRGDVASTSMVPVASAPSGIVFVNGFSKDAGWEVSGLDWKDGEIVHRTKFGLSNLGNGAFGLIQFTKEGDLLFNSIAGPYRVPLSKLSDSRHKLEIE